MYRCRAGLDTRTTTCTDPAHHGSHGGHWQKIHFCALGLVHNAAEHQESAFERGTSAGSQLHSTTPIQVLASLREQGIAGPWGTSFRFFRGPLAFLGLQSLGSCSVSGGAVGSITIPSQVPVLCALQSSVLSSARWQC